MDQVREVLRGAVAAIAAVVTMVGVAAAALALAGLPLSQASVAVILATAAGGSAQLGGEMTGLRWRRPCTAWSTSFRWAWPGPVRWRSAWCF
jgi:hypothetical protein